jgi:ABC-type phosphate/phosphonate transport system substrate-binding protein
MYAFTEAQQCAWRQLFDRFCELAGVDPAQITLRFEHDPALLLEPGLWFGHTCGYPLMMHLRQQVSPFCVPLFDVRGTDGKYYSSRIIVATGSTIESIADSRGHIAAVNNPDSNSGMNVLRHAVASVHDAAQFGDRFFARVINTGGHLHSVQAVASGVADIAAIDCVSYQLIADWQPELCAGLRIIGNSVMTCGLPLVMSNTVITATDIPVLTEYLNRALAACYDEAGNLLHLTGFAPVQLSDYQSIVEIEEYAVGRGYPQLN